MGMFDYIECEYPLSDGHQDINDWQTKDLDCLMDKYKICKDGFLWMDNEKISFRGEVRFYSSDENENWIEYSALFNGKLLNIKELKEGK